MLKGDEKVRAVRKLLCLLLGMLLLSGCAMHTVDQMYQLPKRSQEYQDLQSAIDQHMAGLSYCAPLSGQNPQSVQQADLDGDGAGEYLIFAKGTSDKPLTILIFRLEEEAYVLSDRIEMAGSAYDIVEYAQMDDREGLELIVGAQVSDQVARSVSVYRFRDGKAQEMLSANYTKFLACDMDGSGPSELVVLRPGRSDETSGVAELYRFHQGAMERSNEVSLSAPVDKMKRVITGRLEDGVPGVYVASTVGENSIITDVLALVDGRFTNVSASVGTGTSVETLRNYYIYADDIDEDGVVELPGLATAPPPAANGTDTEAKHLIRWFSMTTAGQTVEKMYTYHDFQNGWYLTLDLTLASRMAVTEDKNALTFWLWDEQMTAAQPLFTIYTFIGPDREELAVRDNRSVLYEGEDVLYSVYLEVASAGYGITAGTLADSFRLIQVDWNTGET